MKQLFRWPQAFLALVLAYVLLVCYHVTLEVLSPKYRYEASWKIEPTMRHVDAASISQSGGGFEVDLWAGAAPGADHLLEELRAIGPCDLPRPSHGPSWTFTIIESGGRYAARPGWPPVYYYYDPESGRINANQDSYQADWCQLPASLPGDVVAYARRKAAANEQAAAERNGGLPAGRARSGSYSHGGVAVPSAFVTHSPRR